jgi:ATP-binding cassette subfamily F protein 3
MDGAVAAPGKLRVGYFTQYQVEELEADDTPLEHMSRLMKGANPSQVRAQLGRFGFSGPMAEQKVGRMSGGEKARLALALITRDAPHLLILDEPTNHLDVDTREALVQALNDYEGAVVVVSHDRHMIEASADRLVLVDAGRAKEFAGSLDDYTDTILGKSPATPEGSKAKGNKKDDRKAAAAAREATANLRKTIKDAEAENARLTARIAELDRALADPKTANASDRHRPAKDLMRLRGEAEKALAASEAAWLAASEALEAA